MPLPASEQQITRTHLIYGLHAVAVLMAVTSSVTVVGNFLFGLPSLAAVILNYIWRGDVAGTFLESHFRWQTNTFWWSLVMSVTVWAVSLILIVILVGLLTLPMGIFIIGVWIAYRVLRGWLTLREGRPMYE